MCIALLVNIAKNLVIIFMLANSMVGYMCGQDGVAANSKKKGTISRGIKEIKNDT